MIDDAKIRLNLYDSSDGPRIMLFGPMLVDLRPLQECFYQLGNGAVEFEIDSLPTVYNSGDVRLRLQSLGGLFKVNDVKHDVRQGIRRIQSDRRSFTWTRTNEGWNYLAELLDDLVNSDEPGHQYLTRYPDEDAIVVVSKGEYSDDVLKL